MVRRPTDYPYLARILMFELAENIARATSIPDAVKIWSSPLNEGLILLVNDKSVKKVGCAIPDCLVCTVSPVFICRSDLRTLLTEHPIGCVRVWRLVMLTADKRGPSVSIPPETNSRRWFCFPAK